MTTVFSLSLIESSIYFWNDSVFQCPGSAAASGDKIRYVSDHSEIESFGGGAQINNIVSSIIIFLGSDQLKRRRCMFLDVLQ
jgi:hypothetical protein